MSFKKDILEQLALLRQSILKKGLTPEQMTTDVIALKSQIDASTAKMQIGSDDNKFASVYNIIDKVDSNYTKVQLNAIPDGYEWVYWRNIMDLAMIWLNRYSKFELPENSNLDYDEIITAMFISILYGSAAYSKTENKAYFVSYTDEGLIGYRANDTFQYDFYTKEPNNDWKINKKYKSEKLLNQKDIVLFQWQMGKIGIFVWYLQELMNYLLMKDVLLLNTNALGAALIMEVYDIENFKQEYKYFTNNRKLIKPLQFNDDGQVNKLINLSPEIAPHIESVLSALRFQKEEMYNSWGISITSAKQQSLSSDANLSASISETRAWEHDRRMIKSLKELGITLELNKPNVIEAQNENADKEGEGETNTQPYLDERKAE